MTRTQTLRFPKRNIGKWLAFGGAAAGTLTLVAAAIAVNSRILGIVAVGLPLIIGAATLAVTYGRNKSYG